MRPPFFIAPAMPKLRHGPPCGPEWRHEVKFDGWRVQVWKLGAVAELHSRRGHDIGSRVLRSLRSAPTTSASTPSWWPSMKLAGLHLRRLVLSAAGID